MKPTWIIENLVKEESFVELAAAVKNAGYPIKELNGDFSADQIKEFKSGNHCVILNASIEMNKLVQSHLAKTCFPLTFSTFKNYLCTEYYPIFGPKLFNDKYVLLPFSELKRQKWFLYEVFGKDCMIFVRPDSGDKSFKAGLIDLQDFDAFCDQFSYLGKELVVISTPKNILGEWRFVVSRKKEIIAVSSYRYQGLITRVPSAPIEATKFCQEVLDMGYFPDSVFCIDVVQNYDKDCFLMELTSFSSAGLYACNKKAIVEKVSEIAVEDYENRKTNIT